MNMSFKKIRGGTRSIVGDHETVTVTLNLSEVSKGKSKKEIIISYEPLAGIKKEKTLTPKRGANTAQSLATAIKDFLTNECKISFKTASKLANHLSLKFT